MTESDETSALRRELAAATTKIERHVAKEQGLGDLNDLDSNQEQRLSTYVEELIEKHEEALMEGNTAEEWKANQESLTGTEFGQLLQARHEIAEQILNLQGDD